MGEGAPRRQVAEVAVERRFNEETVCTYVRMFVRVYVRACVCAYVRTCVCAYALGRAPPHDAYGSGPPPPPRGTCSPSLGRRGGQLARRPPPRLRRTGGGRRGGWLWPDRDRHPATLTRVWVCEALPSEMQGGGEMATSLRRDGTHVSGNAAATTAEPTHTNTTEMAAAATTRRAAGQE